jgi:hypothetical protein
MNQIQAGIYAAAAVAVGLGLAYIHHRGYVSGQAERTSYYELLLDAARTAQAQANERSRQLERSAAEISQLVETEHATREQQHASELAAASTRISSLVRELATRGAGCGGMPAAPGSAAGATGATAGSTRASAAAGRFVATGSACEHDADSLAAWQEWYAKQQALEKK